MELLNHILYINLEHRVDRLAHIKNQLTLLGVSGERFDAIKMHYGVIGCMISHIKCLEIAIKNKYPQVCIMEDDIQFLDIPVFKNSLQKFLDSGTEWDVLFISGNNGQPFEKITEEWVRVYNCHCGTGYIVKQHFYQTLLANMREGLAQLIREPKNKDMYALDMYWKRLQKQYRWFLITPLTVVQAASYSDIEEEFVDYKGHMLDLEKTWLFKKRL